MTEREMGIQLEPVGCGGGTFAHGVDSSRGPRGLPETGDAAFWVAGASAASFRRLIQARASGQAVSWVAASGPGLGMATTSSRRPLRVLSDPPLRTGPPRTPPTRPTRYSVTLTLRSSTHPLH